MEVSEIIERVDIVEYVSQYVDLVERSDGDLWGLSPLKDEVTPSFSVSPTKQRFYDFSSGYFGNVLDFICKYHNCEFHKGLKILKEFAKIEDENSEEHVVKRLLATSIAKKYRDQKKPVKESKSVILPDDYMDRYEWDLSKMSGWLKEGIGEDALKFFQVRFDPYSNRIVYPIRNLEGKIVNVAGRTIDPDFKEKKLRKYTYFKPLGMLDTIYGLFENKEEILKKREIILFEGAKSVMLARGWGIKNTGAVLTSHLNPQQFQILIKLGVRVVFALDSDVDISRDVNIRRLLPYTQVEWVRNRNGLLEDKDAPVDKGFDVFKKLYEERVRLR